MTTNLERQFDTAMMSIYQRAKTEAKYNASVFLGMLNDRGGLATARYLALLQISILARMTVGRDFGYLAA